jgi:hypothetical protein
MDNVQRFSKDSKWVLILGVSVVALIFTMCKVSFAQLSTASVSGEVRDSSGANIPHATIILRNVETSVTNTTRSNSAGAYVFLSIMPGRYTLEATAAGFSGSQLPPFTLTVGQVATVDFALKVGTQTTVEGAAPQIDTSTADLGTVISTQQVNDLPLNGRNFTQLLSLTPGVAPVSLSQNSSGYLSSVVTSSQFTFPAVNGQTNRSNFFLTDGMDNYNSIVSTYAVPPIIDAIQEFKVVSHTDSAEFGSVVGGVVNITTKSGTNSFHGSGWEYDRNDIFDARTYFLPTTAQKATYHQNQFGASAGGPVWIPKLYKGKNRTFFFGAYQGFRYLKTSDTPLKVPTSAQLSGDESDWQTQIYNPFSTRPDPSNPGQYIRDPFSQNQIPQNLIDSRMIAWAQFILPQAGAVIDSSGDNALDTTPVTQNQNEGTIRIDQKIGANDSAFFRYSLSNSTSGSSGGVPGIPSLLSTPGRNWGASYVHVFSPSLVLQAQYSRSTLQYLGSVRFTHSIASIFSQVGFSPAFAGDFTAAAGGGNMLPGPGITGYANGSEDINEYTKASDNNQFSGTVTKTLKNHALTFGAGYTAIGYAAPISYASDGFAAEQTGDTNPADAINTGDPIASFILNVPNNASRRNTNATERPGGVFSAFVQDSWRATPKLTVNAGLRYDYTFIPPYGTDATIGQPGGIETGDDDFSNGTYVLQKLPPSCSDRGHAPCIPGDGSLPEHVVVDPRGKIAYNVPTNWGPRLGLAYQINSRTVVRTGFGIAFDNWASVTQTAQNIEGSWPDIGQQIANNLNQPTAASPTPTVTAEDPFGAGTSSLFPAPTPFNQVNWFFDPHLKNPYSQQWNAGVEHSLGQTTTIALNYVGSGSRRLDVGGYYNTALTPGPGNPQDRAPYPYMAASYYDRSTGSSSYNALQFSLDKRYANGFSYAIAYTWSKTIDAGSDGWYGVEGTVPQDPYLPGAYGSRSVAGFDLRNVISVNTLYRVPVGNGARFTTGNHALDYILGNWQLNNIFTARSGLPFTPTISSDIANTGNTGYETLNVVGNPNLSHRTAQEWFNTAAYAVPPGYSYGTAGRDSLRGNGYWDLDMSLFRLFPVGEGRHIELRAEAFNLLNNVVLGQPFSDFNGGPLFGTINSTANTAREFQLAARFIF